MVNKIEPKERYSFSKLSAFHGCKHAYKLSYIDGKKGIGNCFSSYGTLLHSMMERYANGETEVWSLPSIYEWEFSTAVPEAFPSSAFCKDMRKLYFDQGLNFLKNFSGYNGVKILDVERKFDIEIDDWVFNGVIDMVLEDKDNRLIVQDYKSKGSFKNKRERAEYARQMYLYSLYVKEKYGRYPDLLRFTLMRKQTAVDIPFDKSDFVEAIDWAKNTVKEIRKCWCYEPTYDEFFCQNLCNHRKDCEKEL